VQLSKQEDVTQQLVGQEAVTRKLSLTAVEDQLAELKSLAARLALHPGKPQRTNRSTIPPIKLPTKIRKTTREVGKVLCDSLR
jgi:hypothetical protein